MGTSELTFKKLNPFQYCERMVTLEEENHRYTDDLGRHPISVSRFISTFEQQFDVEGKSLSTAGKRLRLAGFDEPTQKQLVDEQVLVKQEWRSNGQSKAGHGTRVHKAIYDYGEACSCEAEYMGVAVKVNERYLPYYKSFGEQVVYLEVDGLYMAGTADRIIQRKNSLTKVMNLEDFKNYDDFNIFENKYGQYMTGCLSHLEQTKYNRTALQLSVYAYMVEQTYGYKIGSLAIVVIDKAYNVKPFNIPYMKDTIEKMVDYYIKYNR